MDSTKRINRGESPDSLPGRDGLLFGRDAADVQAGPNTSRPMVKRAPTVV